METIARIRREYFVEGKPIEEIVRDVKVSRNSVRKVIRWEATAFTHDRRVQPMPKLGPWRAELESLLGHDGHPLPCALRREIEREIERLELVLEHLRAVEKERDAVLAAAPKDDTMACAIGDMTQLRGIGSETATVLVREIFYRDFENRRQLASYAGLTPTPFMSGAVRRDQTISKSGNPIVRPAMIEIARLRLRYQPGSALSRWFFERVGDMKGRVRRIAIVAMARKLFVALWRYVTTGLIPTGARLKRAWNLMYAAHTVTGNNE